MAWDNAVVTNAGIALLQQVLAGEQLVLDGAAGGTGTVPAAALMAQTALKNQKQVFGIVGSTNVTNGKKINIQIGNTGLAAGYAMQQVGIWAHVGSGASILYAIIQDSIGVSIPSETEVQDFVMHFYAVLAFSNEANVAITIDSSLNVSYPVMWESIAAAVSPLDGKLTSHVDNKLNPHTVTKAQVGLGNADNTSDANKPVSTAMQTALDAKAGKKVPAASGNLAALDAAGNLADSGKVPGDFIPLSQKGAANGIAPLGADAKVPSENLPNIAPTFVYNCTGNADSTAIANIVNNFFNNGTAMAMKLIISGTMGVAFTSSSAIYINATDTRGAVCYLDFSDCHISKITTASMDFLRVDSATAKICVEGLVVTTSRYGVYLTGSNNNNSFSNCTITSSGTYGVMIGNSNNSFSNCTITGISGVYLFSNSNNSFSNCTITGSSGSNTYGVLLISSSNNSFSNCTITGSGTHGVNLTGSSSNNSFSNCTITSDTYGVFFPNTTSISSVSNNSFSNCTITGGTNGVTLTGYSTGSNSNNSFSNCTITGGTNGINITSAFIGIVTFTSCKIIGTTYGVSAQTANTATIVRLIGCSIKGSGSAYDVNQTTAASTMSWFIMGCAFAYSRIYINGTETIAGTAWATSTAYMPAYANMFGRTIT